MSSCRHLWLFKAEHIIEVYFEALLTYEITIIFFLWEKSEKKTQIWVWTPKQKSPFVLHWIPLLSMNNDYDITETVWELNKKKSEAYFSFLVQERSVSISDELMGDIV